MNKKILTITMALVFLSGCSRANNGAAPDYMRNDVYYEAEYAAPSSAKGYGGASDDIYAMSSMPAPMATVAPAGYTAPRENNLMFIKTANVSVNTDRFDFATDELRNIVTIYGGFFESSSTYSYSNMRNPYKRLNATIRVPAAQYEAALKAVESLGKHISTTESSREVSSEYYDLESRVGIKKTEEARLLALIEQATQLSQLIELEQRLGEVRTDVELYESRMKQIDSLASYSTIRLEITEVSDEEKEEDDGFFARLKKGFVDSVTGTLNALQAIVIFLAYVSVPVVLIGLLAFVAILILRKFKKSS